MLFSSRIHWSCIAFLLFSESFSGSLFQHLLAGCHADAKQAHLPWFHDAYSYWDFDEVWSNTVLDLKRNRTSSVNGKHQIIRGPRDNALELVGRSSFVRLGDFSETCLPNPEDCHRGFTITFWIDLKEPFRGGVLLQLGLSRRSRGVTVITTQKKDGTFLVIYVNIQTAIYSVKTSSLSNTWHHVGIVWNATGQERMSVVINCTMTSYGRRRVRNFTGKKGLGRALYLGANHAGKKPTPIAVDDFAIWFKTLKYEKLCQVVREKKVHGNYTSWSPFSSCSSSCGQGKRTRSRFCTNPSPDYGGRDCSSVGPPYETDYCNEKPCPVSGGYAEWSNFSQCSSSCGGGQRYRTRNCTDPIPQYGGENCSRLGKPLEVLDCNIHPCPVHGNYTTWSGFGPCSVSCGDGLQVRNRTCSQPEPQFGGRDCSAMGLPFEVRNCNLGGCPVHGGYSEWSEFSVCSKSCGNATKTRTRTCTNPEPRNGGNNCTVLGSSSDTIPCPSSPCPIHGNYSEWSVFTSCDKSCGNGTKIRQRYCTNPKPQFGGRNCSQLGPAKERLQCNQFPCPVHGNFSEWSDFSKCSRTCGNSTKTRTRNCTNPSPTHGGNNCSILGPSIQVVLCDMLPCPIHGNFSEWSEFSECSSTCGNSTKRRTRKCTNPFPKHGGKDCSSLGRHIEVVSCDVSPCPVHGNFSEWSEFSECSSTCGNSTKRRTRKCTNPFPKHGGKDCSSLGPHIEVVSCDVSPCPVHGNFSEWSEFSECSSTCGNSTKRRTRKCTNPFPKHGGKDCSSLGPHIEVVSCDVSPCPVHGNFSDWSEFTECSSTCGYSTKRRTRNCTNPSPKHGGNDCSSLGSHIEVVPCDVSPCPVHGNFSEWSEFSECSSTCGNSTKRRTRKCTNPFPKHGGKDCSSLGRHIEVVSCDVSPCPVHGNFSEWSEFSECSSTCGYSTKRRTRNCTNPSPKHGGNDCSSLGSHMEVVFCVVSPCPIHGNFSEWSKFSECSCTCGNSTKRRTRRCTNPYPEHGGNDCSSLGPHIEVVSCDVRPCPVHGNFSEWSDFSECSNTCGIGKKRRTRDCSNPSPKDGGNDCSSLGSHAEVASCEMGPCPVHGNFSDWSEFSECSGTCGNSTRKRTRTCTNPVPKHGGNDCSSLGSRVQVVSCDVSPCPVDGNYSEWSAFTACSRTCGKGLQFRYRVCTNPIPLFGGRNCTALGPSNETRPCFLRSCPINGNYTEWSEFAPCSATCGPGTSGRYRFCTNPKPQFGGENCSKLGPSTDFEYCNMFSCPIHGGYSEWTQFGPCSKSCENGTQFRRRYCNNPSPRHGGDNCVGLGPSVETRRCELHLCPDIDLVVTFELNDEKWNDDLLNNSSRGYQNLSFKLKTDIVALHGKNIIKETKMLEFSKGSVITVMEVIYFSQSFPGAAVLYDALYSSQRIGSHNVTPIDFTSTDVPIGFPQNLTAFNRSSTILGLRWNVVPERLSNGFIWGYEVTCKELSPAKTENGKIHTAIFSNTTSGSLKQLNSYTWYWIRITAINRRGSGVPSPAIVVLTDEDVPNSSPNLKPFGYNTSSTSLKVSWRSIDQIDVNGILRGYYIFYKPLAYDVIHNQTVLPDTLSISLSGLEKFMGYSIRVAGFTSKGIGGKSRRTVLYTDEDVPESAPEFNSPVNESSTSIRVKWHDIPKNERNGVIFGYNVYYKETGFPEREWRVIRNIGADKMFVVIRNLTWFTKYSFRISAFTKKGEGVVSSNIAVSTDEDVPCAPPSEISAINSSSTSLWLDWRPLPSNCTRGILRGYIVFYKQQKGSITTSQNITVSSITTEVNITGLRKYTVYTVSLAGFTSKGHGPVSDPIVLSTAEDVPSKSPIRLIAFNTSSTSIRLEWEPIPTAFVHGVLSGHLVHLRKANETKLVREFNITANSISFDISPLLKYTKYFVRITGYTSVGVGVGSPEVLVSTDEDVPSRSPEDLKSISKWSPTSIPLTWKPISDSFYVHGILLGYKIEFQLTKLAGEPLKYTANRTLHVVGLNVLSHTLTDLEIYGTYRIRVWAFTRIGDGLATEVSTETCNCRSSHQTNWWINPPYIFKNSSRISGIIPAIVPNIVTSCCGFCHEHGSTITVFENNKGSSTSFLKHGVSAFRAAIDDKTELHFPMYGQIHQEKYAKRYEFIPLVESPGVVFLVLEDEEGKASKILLDTIWSTLPLFSLISILVPLVSILVWFADKISNPDHFPPSFFHGVFEGIWWSFITMTTIGYGDRFPRSVTARLIGIAWIMLSAVLMSLYTSVLTWNITTEIVITDVKLYGTKVAVILDSAEHRLAVRKNAKVDVDNPYHNLGDVCEALSKRRLQGALVDAYVLGSRKELFDKIGVRVNKIYDYSSAYGIVLAGDAMKLQKCFREYMKQNRKEIFNVIEESVDMIEEDEVSQSVRRAKSLIDPSSVVYKTCLFINLILLLVAIILGCSFECLQKPLKRRYICSKKADDVDELDIDRRYIAKSLQLELQECLLEITKKLSNLKLKHRREVKQWIKFKKELQRERHLSSGSSIATSSLLRYRQTDSSPPVKLRRLVLYSDSVYDDNPETIYESMV